MKKMIIPVLSSLLLISCSVQKSSSVKTMDVSGGGIIQAQLLADLDVKSVKVSGTSTGKKDVPLDNIKQNAVADAVKNANADVLVEPRFDVVSSSSSNTVTVTGFPATYKNIRLMKNGDTTLVKYSRYLKPVY